MKLTNPHLADFSSLPAMFFARAAQGGDAPLLWSKQGKQWQSLSWRETAAQVAALAHNLRALGLSDGDRVALISENRPEWFISDLAIMAAGCVTVPTYITNTENDHQHILSNSGARAAIISTSKLAKIVVPASMRTNVQNIIMIEPMSVRQQGAISMHAWDKMTEGSSAWLAEARDRSDDMTRDQLACLIYTSGTGGTPRGVQQHHGAILHNIAGAAAILVEDFPTGEEVFLSFLPLSHAYEHSAGQFLPILIGAQIYYAEGLEKLISNIEEARPTIMVVVPRLFEVIRARMLKAVTEQGKVANFMMKQALRVGEKKYQRRRSLLDIPINIVLNRTLRKRVRKKFGGRLKAMVSGGAPLNPEVGIFFHALGLTVLQGYGQTEAGPVISCNRPSARIKMESVGPPLKDTEVRIADDGEICVRGELVMHSYWNDEQQTALVLRDGWLHTGDIGQIDNDGHIVITGRKKDMIINDKGDNISPQRVEGLLTLQPEVMQAMVYGDRRPHLVALIVPEQEWVVEWSRANGASGILSELRSNADFHRAMQPVIDRVNRQLPVTERVRNFIFADEAFSIENEQMTPSMKVRRHVLIGIYRERLAALYGRR